MIRGTIFNYSSLSITPFYYQTHLSRCSNNSNNNQDNTLLPFFCGSQRNSTPSRTSGTDCISVSARDTHHCIYFHSPGILHSHLYMYFLFALDIDDSEYTISFWDRVWIHPRIGILLDISMSVSHISCRRPLHRWVHNTLLVHRTWKSHWADFDSVVLK